MAILIVVIGRLPVPFGELSGGESCYKANPQKEVEPNHPPQTVLLKAASGSSHRLRNQAESAGPAEFSAEIGCFHKGFLRKSPQIQGSVSPAKKALVSVKDRSPPVAQMVDVSHPAVDPGRIIKNDSKSAAQTTRFDGLSDVCIKVVGQTGIGIQKQDHRALGLLQAMIEAQVFAEAKVWTHKNPQPPFPADLGRAILGTGVYQYEIKSIGVLSPLH